MSQAHGGPTQLVSREEMEFGRVEHGLQTDKAAVSGPNEATVATKGAGTHRNKQSLDYVLKSGLAGGLAGCAVGRPLRRQDLEQQANSPSTRRQKQ